MICIQYFHICIKFLFISFLYYFFSIAYAFVCILYFDIYILYLVIYIWYFRIFLQSLLISVIHCFISITYFSFLFYISRFVFNNYCFLYDFFSVYICKLFHLYPKLIDFYCIYRRISIHWNDNLYSIKISHLYCIIALWDIFIYCVTWYFIGWEKSGRSIYRNLYTTTYIPDG